MRHPKVIAFVATSLTAYASAKPYCPIWGPLFPSPENMRHHPRMQETIGQLEDYFSKRIDTNSTLNNRTFSYGYEVYTTHEGLLWSRYYQTNNYTQLNTTGVKKTDSNTVHRVGSVSKTFTVLTFLASVGDRVWNDPITKYIPELKAAADDGKGKSHITTPEWDEITVGSLISFFSGLVRDYSMLGELTQEWDNKTTALRAGFPPLPAGEEPPCGKKVTCTRKQFLAGLVKQPPLHAPYQTPVYSNLAYVLLSYVAESISGKPFLSMVEEAVIKPLNLTSTFTKMPDDKLGAMPSDPTESGWNYDMGNESPTGAIYSSAGDLSKLGQAIMKSTLLKPSMTRRWLKPVSFLPDPHSAVGMPWGIREIPLIPDKPYQYVSSYTKAGAIGKYTAMMNLLPDVNLGWTVMSSGDFPTGVGLTLTDNLADKMLATWVDVARDEASKRYSGTYVTSTPGLRSNITINVEADKPGLGIESWYSNGTDMKTWGVAFSTQTDEKEWDKLTPSVRLYPTGVEESLPDGGKKVSFRAVFEDIKAPESSNSYATDCTSWMFTSALYGGQPFDLLVFTVNPAGKAVAVENFALRSTLQR